MGEETGALDTMLNKVADFYDEEVAVGTDGLTSLIEPLMMASLGVIVGGMVIALYLPMSPIPRLFVSADTHSWEFLRIGSSRADDNR